MFSAICKQQRLLGELAGRWLVVLILSQLLVLTLFTGAAHAPAKAVLLALATSMLFSGYLLYPGRLTGGHFQLAKSIIWGGLLAGGLLLLALLQLSQVEPILILRLACAVILLSLLLSLLTRLTSLTMTDSANAPLLVFLTATIVTTAPIWIGAWVEFGSNSRNITDSVVAISPLSYFAVMIDYDYLRSQWFYTHTPFGTLRYSYPGWLSYTIAYLGITILLSLMEKHVCSVKGRSPNNN